MTANKEWPCEHVKQLTGNWHFMQKIDGRLFWSKLPDDWFVCPFYKCLAKRPEEPRELYLLLHELHDASYGIQAIEILKWFKENFPSNRNYHTPTDTHYYREEIEKWLDKEIERCK